MTTKKVLITLFTGVFLAILVFCSLLYFALRTKVKDVSEEAPFQQYIATNIVLGNEALLVNNDPAFVYEQPLKMQPATQKLFEGVTIAHRVKLGDTLRVDAVKNFTNGTSGITHTVLFGSLLRGKNAEVPFEFLWDSQEISITENGTRVISF